MLPLSFADRASDPLNILCLGAHSDDIEIGAGATILRLLEQHPGSCVTWVVFAATGLRGEEARRSAAAFLHQAGEQTIHLHTFRDGFFPAEFTALKQAFEALKAVGPDIILTHHRDDHHQDHRIIAELTWNTFRDHLVMEYEIPKFDPDLGNPNIFVPIMQDHARLKVELLMKHFESQRTRRWFCPETFMGLMCIRGVQAASSTGLAEGFYARKLLLSA